MSWKIAYALLPLLSLLIWRPAEALIEQPIDEKHPLPVTFSKTSHNRIAVEQGSVEKIFGPEAYFSIEIDSVTGNAFVNVLRDISNPITLTVVTHTGLVQDLAVTSTEGPSEHLILKEEEDADEISQDYGYHPPSGRVLPYLHQPTIEFLNTLLEGKTPIGYGIRVALDKDDLSLPSPLKATLIKAFESPFEEIAIYRIKNSGKDPIVISAETLKKNPALSQPLRDSPTNPSCNTPCNTRGQTSPQASWVFLNAHELRAQEQALCIISFSKQEG